MKIKTPFFIIDIEWLFLIILFIFIFSDKVKKFLISFYICYLFIVFHEFSHIFIATILGKNIEILKITLSGVCINLKKEKYNLCDNKNNKIENLKNILIYIVGPISNLILANIFSNIEMIYQINIFLAIVNLLPLFPLDGYNILLNILRYFKINEIIIEIILKTLIYVIYFLLIILGILQIILVKNISLVIFMVYLFLLQNTNNNNKKKYRIHKA